MLVLVGRDPRELVNVPVLPVDELLASKVTAVTAEGIGWDPEHGELWFAGETAEAVLLELDARRRELRGEVEELAGRAPPRRRPAASKPSNRPAPPPSGSRRSRICATCVEPTPRDSPASWTAPKGSTRP